MPGNCKVGVISAALLSATLFTNGCGGGSGDDTLADVNVTAFWETLGPTMQHSMEFLNNTVPLNSSHFHSEAGAPGTAIFVFNPMLFKTGTGDDADDLHGLVEYQRYLFDTFIKQTLPNVKFTPDDATEKPKFCNFAHKATYAKISHWVSQFDENGGLRFPDEQADQAENKYCGSFPDNLGEASLNNSANLQTWESAKLSLFAGLFSFMNQAWKNAGEAQKAVLSSFSGKVAEATKDATQLYWYCHTADVAMLAHHSVETAWLDFGIKPADEASRELII